MSRPFTPSAIFPASSAVALSALVGATLPAPHALAQSITPATDGTGTQVAPNGSVYDITGGALSGDGANLFHSFQQFGLTPAEVANFIADPAVQNILGRVTGGDVSVIDGMLQVTGSDANLYLINPAGILFGPNAVLNLDGSFTATSASAVGFGENWLQAIGDADYARLNGDPTSLAFGDNAAALINSGNLAVDGGETLALVGGSVVNTGTLTAPGGQIVVMAVPGENLVRITPQGARLSLELATLPDAALPETSSGLTPLDIPSLLRAGGENVATGLTANEDGTVSLTGSERTLPTTPGSTIASGNIDASGPTGGTVYILGELVGVVDADVDAAGDAGGGTILVGGDYQGQGPVPNARRTYIDADSTLAADAVETGDGGTVIAWADEATQFEGLITARGGSAAGDGGFVEVSGREVLAFNGLVDVSAAHGDWGTILLDPENITITGEPAVGTSPGVEATLPDIFADEFSSIVPSDISILNSVLASQTGNVILEATNDIQFEFSSFGISLNFVPGGSITFTADADNDGAGIFAMGALDSITTAGPRDITISGAAIELGTLDADGGNITLIGDAINLLGGPDSIRSTGNLSIRPVSSTTDIRLGLVEPSLGLLDLTAFSLSALADGFSTITIGSSDITGNITLAEDVTFSGSFSTTLETGGSIDTSGHTLAGTGTTGLTLIAGNSITTSEVTTEGQGISIIGDADGDGEGPVEISGEIDSNGGLVSISGSSSSFGAGILTSSTFDSVTGAVISSGTISSGGGDISLFGTSNRFGDGVEIGHNLTSEGGDIFITGTSISNNGISIEANVNSQGGQIALDGDSTFSEGISLSAPITSGGGNITLTGSSTENVGFENDFQDNNLAGTIDSQGGDITIIGSSTGASSFDDGINLFAPITSRGGNVTLTGSSNGGAGIYSGFVDIPDGESIAVVDSQGGDITFTGISQSYIGILVVEDITSQGGDIAFTGDSQSNLGILLTENLNSSSGGNITLRTASSPISAQNLTTTGGNIDIQAGTTLTAVNLNSSNNSPGGDVTLEAPGGIRVNSINTQGSTTGGAIRVTTSGGFQALGSFADRAGVVASLSSWGGTRGGPITLAYGPNSFTIGDPSSNGTQAAIHSGDVNLANATFSGSQVFGTGTPGEVRLVAGISSGGGTTGDGTFLPPEPERQAPPPRRSPRMALTSIESTALNNQQLLPEQQAQAQFSNYFGGTLQPARDVSIGESRATLRDIQAKTGEVPAFLYVRFNQNENSLLGDEKDPNEPILELLLITAEDEPKLVRVLHTNRQEILAAQEKLRRQITNPNLTNNTAYLQSAQQLYDWIIAPIQSDLEAAGVTNIGFIMDSGLRTLPLAALHDGDQFLVKNYSIGLIPSVGLIDTDYVNLNRQSSSLVVAGSAEFINQTPLWAANLEMAAINDFWKGGAVTGTNFTVDALQRTRQQAGIIHMATHAEFLRGAPSNSYLQFFDRRLRLNDVPELGWYAPQVELVTLSACQTAMGNLDAELGFAGFALQAGAKSALASLWKVSDEATAGLMVNFYQQLDQQTTKAETLRQAQLAMIRGEVYTDEGQLVLPGQVLPLPAQLTTDSRQDFSHPFYWAAFTMVGSPW